MTATATCPETALLLQSGSMAGGGADTAAADTKAPSIIGAPKNGQAADGDLVLTFDENIQAGSGNLVLRDGNNQVVLSESVAGSAAVTIAGATLTLHLVQRLAYDTTYYLALDKGAVKDLAGNAYDPQYWNSYAFHSGLSPVALDLSGGNLADTLTGSDLADTLSGGGGNDSIIGYGGNDVLDGGNESPPSPYYYGYGDTVDGGAGNDTIHGNDGDDYLSGGDGNDQIYGDDGKDTLYGSAGDDLLDGGAGNDLLSDSSGIDTLRGGAGDDSLGGAGSGILDGGAGNDTLEGYDGAAYIGGSGNDSIRVRVWSTTGLASSIDGGDGDDTIALDVYSNTTASIKIAGGAGVDTYRLNFSGVVGASARLDVTDFKAGAGGDVIDPTNLLPRDFQGNPFNAASGLLRLVADDGGTMLQLKLTGPFPGYVDMLHLAGVKPADLAPANFTGGLDPLGAAAGLTLTGTAGADALSGLLADDTISGLDDNDTLSGGGGNDLLDGGAGNDSLYGEAGNDTLRGGDGNDFLSDAYGDNVLQGGAGDDQLSSTSRGAGLLDGGAGNDSLRGGYGADTLAGGAGDDTIDLFNDRYDAFNHTVSASGGDGNDRLIFRNLYNTAVSASGGKGADTFEFMSIPTDGAIVIDGFSAAEGDRLDLRALLPGQSNGNPFGTAGYLKAVQAGADVVVSIDSDGAAGPLAPTALFTLKGVDLATLPASAFAGGLDPSGTDTGMNLTGTAGNDSLDGGWLQDTIDGGAGSDIINGGPGADKLYGGDQPVLGGGDTIDGGAGDDLVVGSGGADSLIGGYGNDTLEGNAGNDSLSGGIGNDTLRGGDGDDRLTDGSGSNLLEGGAGNDTLSDTYDFFGTDAGNTTLNGGAGHDRIYAANGGDVIDGGAGNDTIDIAINTYNGTVHIEAAGGDGDDVFTIALAYSYSLNKGTVAINGGAGRDTYRFSSYSLAPDALTVNDFKAGAGGDLLDVLSLFKSQPSANPFGATAYLRLVQQGADTLLQFNADGTADTVGFVTVALLKNVQAGALTGDNFVQGLSPDGSSTGMTLQGGSSADSIVGGLLDDTIHGGAGNDSINGGYGSDALYGDDGNDSIASGYGHSQLYGGQGNDVLNGASYWGSGGDTLAGGEGNDTLEVWAGNNVLRGDEGNDTLRSSGSGDNLLSGGIGNDTLTTAAHSDTLEGGAGDDTLIVQAYWNTQTASRAVRLDAGDGDDLVTVLAGTPQSATVDAHGAAGRDTYRMDDGSGKMMLTIDDFQAGAHGDVLDFSILLPGITTNPFAAGGKLLVVQQGADSVIRYTPDSSAPGKYNDIVTLRNVDKSALTAANMWNGFDPAGSTRGLALTGTTGDDKLVGGALDDTLAGGAGHDTLVGNLGNDSLDGGDGRDWLYDQQDGDYSYQAGRNGDDKLAGGAGDDFLFSYGGNDILDGGAGNDGMSLYQGAYDTTERVRVQAFGGDGDDVIEVALGGTVPTDFELSGGKGKDTFVMSADHGETGATITILDFQAGTGGDVLDAFTGRAWKGATPFSDGSFRLLQRGADTVLQYDTDVNWQGASYRDVAVLRNVDKSALVAGNMAGWPADGSTAGSAVTGTDADDTLTGTQLGDTISGGGGNDVISGLGGNDSLDGGPGNDRLIGGPGGKDTLAGGDGDDEIDLGAGGLALGGTGNDHLVAQTGTATLDGGSGDDVLEVSFDPFLGHRYDITLQGGDGDDTFRVANGTRGVNRVVATGGAGHDIFEVNASYTVTDFQAGADGDLIRLGNLLQPGTYVDNPFANQYLRLLQSGADTLLQVDSDGVGTNGMFKTVLTLQNVQASSLGAGNFFEKFDPHPGAVTPPPEPTPTPAPEPTPVAAPVPAQPVLPGQTYSGGAGNDVLTGGAGNDLLVGGSGLDTAVYGGARAGYTVSRDATGWHVVDARGQDGADTLQEVERLQFADGALALDLDGVAGQAYRMYRAAFDRAPDLEGLGFWIGAMDKGALLREVAQGFAGSQEFAKLYGAPANADVVGLLYKNVLHRAPDEGGFAFWLDALERKVTDLPGLLASFSESPENQAAVAELIGSGIAFTPYGG